MKADLLLEVPFNEKDEAKSLGAKWNPKLKCWYVPAGFDKSEFSKWLPPDLKASSNFKAISPIYLARSPESCWKCGSETAVFCIAAAGFIEDNDEVNGFVTFSNLGFCENTIRSEIEAYAPLYRVANSKQADSHYYMNHCEHCNAKMGDFYMHNEPEGAFCPVDEVQGGNVTLYELVGMPHTIAIDASPGFSEPNFIELHAKREKL